MKKTTSTNNFSILFTLFFLLFTFLGFGQSQTFTSNGSFTVPAGVTQVTVEAWGGGGAGGGCTSLDRSTGGGGGGGTYTKVISVAVTPLSTITVTVGAGGVVASAANGGNGGTSTFSSATPISAIGGKGGKVNGTTTPLNGIGATATAGITFSGGNGGTGNATTTSSGTSGGGGGGAGNGGNGGNSTVGAAGSGGPGGIPGGIGAAGRTNSGDGIDATSLSGGGGGARNGGSGQLRSGGKGGDGQVVVTWIVPPLTNGPGGVTSNLQLWLRADLLNGTTGVTDNTNVTTWNTQAYGSNATVNTVGQEPKYLNNATRNINFNAVVDFTNDYNNAPNEIAYNHLPQQYLEGSSGYYTQDMFIVSIPDIPISSTTPSMDLFCGDSPDVTPTANDGSGIGYGRYSIRTDDELISYAVGSTPTSPSTLIKDRGYGIAHTSTTATYNNVGIINARNSITTNREELYYNGLTIGNTEVGNPQFINLNDTRYWIGRSQAYRGSLDARVAEVITYSSRKNDATERSNIQSYLAIKYGITLGVNGTSMNYTNSAAEIIWNQAANAGYNYNITGIGRDDLSKLSQKQSKTVNTANDLTIGLQNISATNTTNTNTFDTDKKFLVWGNNNGTLSAQPQVVVNISSGITSPASLISDVSFVSIGRTWKVVETGGNVPSVKVSIPSTMLTATITPPGDFLMFISSTPTFDPTAEYRIMNVNGANLETSYDFNGTKYITFGYAPEKTFIRCVKFNGTTDYMDAGKVLDLNSSFTVSAWINRDAASLSKTIISKRNSSFSEGYDLGINSTGRAEMSWMVAGTKHTITSSAIVPQGIWHHIAVIYNGTTAKIYIDGVTIASTAIIIPNVPVNSQSFLIAAADGANPTSYFAGSIDEVRVWKIALTEAQLRYVMNQEILNNLAFTNGAIIPNTISQNDIKNVPWTDLSVYYPMSTYTYTNAKDISSNNFTAALRNLKTVDRQTAPLPYESANTGLWQTAGTWTNSNVQDLPNSVSIEDAPNTIDWNIVKTSHNITSHGNKTLLGLFVNSNTLTATTSGGLQTDGTKIEVSHYLKLDGIIDLVGRSQLVQSLNSDLDVTSAGSIERDQQGQGNKYNYNYWSSPVSKINSTLNNQDFTINGILRDGTSPANPILINWIGGYDGALGTPISLATYWLFKFDNLGNAYANWTSIGQNGLLQVGKGFTMKGNNGLNTSQNYTFVGKPNNGTISNTVNNDQLLLTGNPYPSAIDANKFINDNISSIKNSNANPVIDGGLYFWEHYTNNNTHVLRDYQGGYAIRNLSGGLAPSSVGIDFIRNDVTTLRPAPKQYIPVGQGFFVIGKNASSAAVTFNNSQRAFIKEDDAANSQVMYKVKAQSTNQKQSIYNDNSNDFVEKDTHKKIRLGFNFYSKTYHRQVLLAFMDDKADSEMNDGYDAYNIDNSPSDMYLLNGENELAIQGEGYFDPATSYPIGVRIETAGKISFGIDALENFDPNQAIYIYDAQTDLYHSITDKLFEIEVNKGIVNNRFSLRFTDRTLGVQDNTIENSIAVHYTQATKILTISNSMKDNTIEIASLYDIQGKAIANWKVKEKDQTDIKIQVQAMATGVYIVKLKTTKGNISKKIIVR